MPADQAANPLMQFPIIPYLLIFVIFFGIKGEVSKRYEHQQILALSQCTATLSKPFFSQTVYLNLPWMQRGEPFIPGYTYWAEKNRRERYEKGGIEGLINEGYFASLLLEKSRKTEIRASFEKYTEQPSSCSATHVVLTRNSP